LRSDDGRPLIDAIGVPQRKRDPVSDSPDSAKPDGDGSPIAAIAKDGEPDRYLAALLSTPAQRADLLALAALSTELYRIPQRIVHEPAMGEIRLQWWRDALALPPELRAGHPVADAIRKAAHDHEFPADLLEALIDARSILLDATSPLTEDGFRGFLWKAEGSLFALGAQVAGSPDSCRLQAGCTAAGQAYGLARLLLELPRMLAAGRIPLAKVQLDSAGLSAEEMLAGAADGARIEALLAHCSAQIRRDLDVARQFTATLPRAWRVAFLPLALVEPYLRVLERAGGALLREETRVAPLTRVCRIAAAHLFGRL
jgi:15-cis-phytoene synthase